MRAHARFTTAPASMESALNCALSPSCMYSAYELSLPVRVQSNWNSQTSRPSVTEANVWTTIGRRATSEVSRNASRLLLMPTAAPVASVSTQPLPTAALLARSNESSRSVCWAVETLQKSERNKPSAEHSVAFTPHRPLHSAAARGAGLLQDARRMPSVKLMADRAARRAVGISAVRRSRRCIHEQREALAGQC